MPVRCGALAMLVLDLFLHRLIRRGTLTIIDAEGSRRQYGSGEQPRITVRLTDRRTEMRLLVNPEFETGEAFMDGRLIVEEGDIYGLSTSSCRTRAGPRPSGRWRP